MSDALAFVTTVNMKTNASEPTDADRTTGSYSAALTGLTIGPNETGYVIFRIGIDERPNLHEPQLRDSGNDTIIQNLTSLGFATELSETAGHRYFYLPLHFPIEDTGTLRLRRTTRTAHHDWLGTVSAVKKYEYALGSRNVSQTSPDTFDDDDLLIIGGVLNGHQCTTASRSFGDLLPAASDNTVIYQQGEDGGGMSVQFWRSGQALMWEPKGTTSSTDRLYVTKIGGAFS